MIKAMSQPIVAALVGWVGPKAVTHQPAAWPAMAMPLVSLVGYAAKRLTHPTKSVGAKP